MKKKLFASIFICLFVLIGATSGYLEAATPPQSDDFHDKYRLRQVMILSRHNIRSPLSGSGSVINDITPHKWFAWTSAPSELSLRGGQLETMMGQYFRQWLVKEKLITDNYLPKDGEMRFYANSKQRTIATAKYFSAGMLPIANVTVEHKFDPENTDLVFSPRLTFMSEAYKLKALEEISRMKSGNWENGAVKNITSSYSTIEKVLDFPDSLTAKQQGIRHFLVDDPEIVLEQGKQPAVKGTLKTANAASDALVLQYYEEPDKLKAGFGHKLTDEDWEKICKVKLVYDGLLFTAPSVSVNIAHPLLNLMHEELTHEGRKFTFLCGHDSNIASVLAALEVEDYYLPHAVEKKTPIGAKLVFGRWQSKDGQEYVSVDIVYQSTQQLRERSILTLANPPMVFKPEFKGISRNADGLYSFGDWQQRFRKAIAAYDKLAQAENLDNSREFENKFKQNIAA